MTRDEAVSLIQRRLGNRTDLADDIITEMQNQQNLLEMMPELPWFLLKVTSTLQADASNYDQIDLPSDFILEYEEDDLEWNNDGTWVPIDKDDWDAMKRADLSLYDAPSFYASIGEQFWLRPAPESQLTFRLRYYAKAAVLSTDIENVWLANAPEVLIGQTGVIMASYLRDKEAKALFDESLKTATVLMQAMNDRKKTQNQNMQMRTRGPDE